MAKNLASKPPIYSTSPIEKPYLQYFCSNLHTLMAYLRCISFRDRTSNSFQPQEKVLRKFASKINVEKYDGPTSLPNHISTALSEHSKTQAVKTVKSRSAWTRFNCVSKWKFIVFRSLAGVGRFYVHRILLIVHHTVLVMILPIAGFQYLLGPG